MFGRALRVVVSFGVAAGIFAIVPAAPAGAQTACTIGPNNIAGILITVGEVNVGGGFVDIVDTTVCVVIPPADGSALACPDAALVLVTVREVNIAGAVVRELQVCVAAGVLTGVPSPISSNSPLPLPGGSGDDGAGGGFVPVLVVASFVALAAGRRIAQRRHRAPVG